MKPNAQAETTTNLIYKTEYIEGSTRIVTVYYWFENIWCAELLGE